MNKPFYITTTLPYVNASPHIGFAMEIIRADVVARMRKLAGYDVFFNTGTDEHGLKIYKNALAKGEETKKYVDEYAEQFRKLIPALGIMPEVNFIRTTDEHHVMAAQEFWKKVNENGFIYKKNYSVKYCVGCELEKTDSELTDGRCPLHPLQDIEIIKEENYFFKFGAFGEKLLALYAARPDFVIPDFRQNEIKTFVERGLEDFSISRLASKMPWGISVPNDPDQVMYVWFDALVNYISAIGWPDRMDDFEKWHVATGGMVQYCGKDNLRQQSAMWQAMLMAAGLPPSKTIVIDGFVTGEGGVKMSKSLGNTIDPNEIIREYGTDALRYFVIREIQPFEDSPFTALQFKDAYNAHLANGLGNLVSRVMKMAEEYLPGPIKPRSSSDDLYGEALETYDLKKLADKIWAKVQEADQVIQKEQPFKVIKTDPEKGKKIIADLVERVAEISSAIRPILPETAAKIEQCLVGNKKPQAPLFVRK